MATLRTLTLSLTVSLTLTQVSKRQIELTVREPTEGVTVTRLGPNPSYLQRLEGASLGAPVALAKGAPALMAPGDVVWLGRDKCALRLLELPRLPSRPRSGGLAEPSGKLAEASARLGGGGGGVLHRRSISDGQPTGGAGGGAAAPPPFRLSGTLHKKAQRTGIYQKREVVVEGSTLTYRTLTSEPPDVGQG